MKKEKQNSINELKCALIFACVIICILLIGLGIYHFYQMFEYIKLIDLYELIENTTAPSNYTWQAVGNCFFAIFDILFVPIFCFICYIIYQMNTKINKLQNKINEMNKTICPNCGEKLEPDVSFCSKCGCKLKEETQQKENDLITQKIKESD